MDNSDKKHAILVTLSHEDWKKLKRASITQKRTLKAFLNDALHRSAIQLDRFGRLK